MDIDVVFMIVLCRLEDKAVLWQDTPEFCDTVDTYASYANHVVKRLCLKDFNEYVNSL